MPRQSVCKRIYIDSDGNEFSSLPADPSKIVALDMRFINGVTRRTELKNYPKNIQLGATFHGLNQGRGDAFSGVDGDVEAAIIAFDKRDATLMAGQWSSRVGGGGGAKSDSILAEAMLAYFADVKKTKTKDGTPIDATWVRSFLLAEDVDDNEAKATRSERTKSWKANPDVKVHYERIRSEREAAKTSTVAAAAASDI